MEPSISCFVIKKFPRRFINRKIKKERKNLYSHRSFAGGMYFQKKRES
jgi:hypothetical protein